MLLKDFASRCMMERNFIGGDIEINKNIVTAKFRIMIEKFLHSYKNDNK